MKTKVSALFAFTLVGFHLAAEPAAADFLGFKSQTSIDAGDVKVFSGTEGGLNTKNGRLRAEGTSVNGVKIGEIEIINGNGVKLDLF